MPLPLEGGAGYEGSSFGMGGSLSPQVSFFLMSTDGAIFPERLREMTFLRSKKGGLLGSEGKIVPSG